MKFTDLNFNTHRRKGGIYAKHTFRNGFGVAIYRYTNTLMNGVIDEGSLGSLEGLFEAYITKNGKVTFDTPLADDVLGHLNEDQIEDLLSVVEVLHPEEHIFIQSTLVTP